MNLNLSKIYENKNFEYLPNSRIEKENKNLKLFEFVLECLVSRVHTQIVFEANEV